jgi:hypothetical protein
MLPTGGFLLRENVGGSLTARYHGNPFAPGTTVNAFQPAGTLPTEINGAPFDADGDGRLEADEPFQLGAILSGTRLQVLINGEPVAAANGFSTTGTGTNNFLGLWKNRYSGGAAVSADPYFDNLMVEQPVVIRHLNDIDPNVNAQDGQGNSIGRENWIVEEGGTTIPAVGPITEIIEGETHRAWAIDDDGGNSRKMYKTAFSDEEKAKANANGWRYTMTMRVVDDSDALDFSIHGQVADGDWAYTLLFGSDDQGNAIVDLHDTGPNGGVGNNTHVIPGGSVYHEYVMEYDPLTDTVDLIVDGQLVEADYAGRALSGYNRITFGSNQGSSAGHAHYEFVQFEIIPEPSTLVLLALGLLVRLGGSRRRTA